MTITADEKLIRELLFSFFKTNLPNYVADKIELLVGQPNELWDPGKITVRASLKLDPSKFGKSILVEDIYQDHPMLPRPHPMTPTKEIRKPL